MIKRAPMPVNKKSRISRVITWLHLWLGLVSGIIVVILCITGCLFVFHTEITGRVHKKELFIAPSLKKAPLPLSVLQRKAEQALGKPVSFITTYTARDRAWEFMAYKEGDADALTFPGSVDYYESAFVDPYTGQVTGRINYMHDFFIIVKYIHWSLYLSTKYGQPITGWATLIFVISLVTGFIMWIPRRWSRAERRKALTVKWRAAFKRLNYDLHNVLGFYAVVIALLLGFTGMVYSFSWFRSAVYAAGAWTTGAEAGITYTSDTANAVGSRDPLDRAFAATLKAYPVAKRYGVSEPSSPRAPLAVTAYQQREVYYDATTLYFDRYSGRPLGGEPYYNMNNDKKLIMMNYDIHVGAVGGLAGKIIVFVVTLICGSLPVTGFIIWWGKRKKEMQKTLAWKKQAPKPSVRS
jgi:uncharacterized iron-regulated membrane protein